MRPRTLLLLAIASMILAGCGGGEGAGGSGEDSDAGAGEGGEALAAEDIGELLGTTVEGFQSGAPFDRGSGKGVTYTGTAPSGFEVEATVTLAPCSPIECFELTADIDEQHEQNLRSNLAPVHLDNPDLVFDYGLVDLGGGSEGFYTFTRSFVDDGSGTATARSYTVLHHDDVNLMTISVSPPLGGFEGPESVDDLLTQEDGRAVAQTFFEAYSTAF